MPTKLTAAHYLDREFLEIRSRLLDIAAALDRMEGASGAAAPREDPRWTAIQRAAELLTDGKPDRAERIQMIFSLPYDPDWRRPSAPGA